MQVVNFNLQNKIKTQACVHKHLSNGKGRENRLPRNCDRPILQTILSGRYLLKTYLSFFQGFSRNGMSHMWSNTFSSSIFVMCMGMTMAIEVNVFFDSFAVRHFVFCLPLQDGDCPTKIRKI